MKPIFFLTAFTILAILSLSCSKEKDKEPKLRLLNISETTYEGVKVTTTYHYNAANQLVEIKHTNFNQKFNYDDKGVLASYELNGYSYSKTEYYYKNNRLIMCIRKSNIGENMDTTDYYYNAEGIIEKRISHFWPNWSEYLFVCDKEHNVIRKVGSSEHDTSWYAWDANDNLTEIKTKARDYETGGYPTFIDQISYTNSLNFLDAVPYPETYLFIRKLSPQAVESKMLSSNKVYSAYYPIPTPVKVLETNSKQYPTKLRKDETIYTLVYEEY